MRHDLDKDKKPYRRPKLKKKGDRGKDRPPEKDGDEEEKKRDPLADPPRAGQGKEAGLGERRGELAAKSPAEWKKHGKELAALLPPEDVQDVLADLADMFVGATEAACEVLFPEQPLEQKDIDRLSKAWRMRLAVADPETILDILEYQIFAVYLYILLPRAYVKWVEPKIFKDGKNEGKDTQEDAQAAGEDVRRRQGGGGGGGGGQEAPGEKKGEGEKVS